MSCRANADSGQQRHSRRRCLELFAALCARRSSGRGWCHRPHHGSPGRLVDIITPTGTYAHHERGGIWWFCPYRRSPLPRVRLRRRPPFATDLPEYLPTLGEMDTYLISEGAAMRICGTVLGAHVKTTLTRLGETTRCCLRRVG